jgi:Tol biopolymer transport system component
MLWPSVRIRVLRAGLAASACAAFALLAAGGAGATFPGRNGVIAFASNRHPLLDHPQISALDIGTGELRNLSVGPGRDFDAVPSPDGSRIAFTRLGNEGGIWLMNADGGDQRLLIRGGYHPVWSPDGKSIAFNGGGPGDCPPGAFHCGHLTAVWTMRTDGSRLRRHETATRNATWSPDSRRIAYEAQIDPWGESHGIRVANRTGRKARWVSRWGRLPAWSPDGRLIAYDGGALIGAARPDGTHRRTVAAGRFPMWSPRGNRLAYLCGRQREVAGRTTFALCVVDQGGHHRRVVARSVRYSSGATADNAEVAWSPNGLRLAYAMPDGIVVVDFDGRHRRRVAHTEVGFSVTGLVWSGDRRKLLFSQTRDYNDLEIYTIAADGSGAAPLTENDVEDLQPAWSPDGKRLAWVHVLSRTPEVWLMNGDGTGPRLVIRNGFDPAWTADGARIVFSRYVGPSTQPYWTYSVDLATGEERVLVRGGYHAVPSPDGTKLAYLGGSFGSLFVAAADGSGATELVNADTTDSVSWSPDSTSLVFRGSSGSLYTIRADGSGLTRVGSQDARSPTFSPDGSVLAFADFGARLEVSALDGSARTTITADGRNDYPDWQPLPR